MRIKPLYVLIQIRTEGEVGTVKHVQSSNVFLLTVKRWCFFCGFFVTYFHVVFVMLSCLFLATL